jgi:hypothetical protein
MRRSPVVVALLLAGCVTATPDQSVWHDIQPFSANRTGAALPYGWQPLRINPQKRPTRYELVADPLSGRVVLHALAEHSASGLRQRLDVDPSERPIIAWRWRVVDLISGADNQDRFSEDAPVRLMLFFDGDKRTLSAKEQALMEMAQLLAGHDVPFATLMYVWENRFARETVLANSFTGQIKMIVVGTGRDRLGAWVDFERDYAEDYRRAFGALPGRLIGIGLMTDTDNTADSVEAFYGDIVLKRARR